MNLDKTVEEVLKEYELARNNDNVLWAIVMQRQGAEFTREQFTKIKDGVKAESVTRIRRKLQSKGKYPPKPVVKQYREARRVQHVKKYGGWNQPMHELYGEKWDA